MSWVIQALGAMVIFSVMFVVVTANIQRGTSIALVMAIIAGTWLPSFLYWGWSKGFGKIDKFTIWSLIAVSLASILANWWQFSAGAKAPNPGLAMAVISCQVAGITLLAKFFLGNNINASQLLGMSFCLVGVILITIGK